ncbi:MAG TPA: zinc ribbon domain-containing protein [Gemmatimonadales bacterium]|nr:zinc ribbon domain-containing protein [Gemmatimonadales bacterium]
MPIYEYVCSACDNAFEKLVRGDTRVACPECHSAKVERLISAPARPAGASGPVDYSSLGPPKSGGGCGSGGCGCH